MGRDILARSERDRTHMNSKFSLCRDWRGVVGAFMPSECVSTNDSKKRNGFTLMELLIVIAIILILMLMAIPTIGSLKKKANETSAMQSVRAIMQAQMQYESSFPTNGYACSLTALGGDPKSGPPSATSSQLLQGDLTSGIKSGYIFTINNCTKVNINGVDRITGYQMTAVPVTVGQTGDRGFCSDQFGTIKADLAGGTNCTVNLQ
jgi:type IV pilus assembly protein PilA